MVPVFYSPAYVGSHTAFDTTRKAKWVADSLEQRPIAGIELHAPPPVTEEQVARVHDPEYIRAVVTGHPRSLAASQGLDWDAQFWPMVAASTGGVIVFDNQIQGHPILRNRPPRCFIKSSLPVVVDSAGNDSWSLPTRGYGCDVSTGQAALRSFAHLGTPPSSAQSRGSLSVPHSLVRTDH